MQGDERRPVPSGEWRARAEKDGVSKATFFRLAKELREAQLATRDGDDNYLSTPVDLRVNP